MSFRKTIQIYCDGCYNVYRFSSLDRLDLNRQVEFSGWLIKEGLHYCPKCRIFQGEEKNV